MWISAGGEIGWSTPDAAPRQPRHPVPAVLETETGTLDPEDTLCPRCGVSQQKIGEEVSEGADLIPATLVRESRLSIRGSYSSTSENRLSTRVKPIRIVRVSRSGVMGLGWRAGMGFSAGHCRTLSNFGTSGRESVL